MGRYEIDARVLFVTLQVSSVGVLVTFPASALNLASGMLTT